MADYGQYDNFATRSVGSKVRNEAYAAAYNGLTSQGMSPEEARAKATEIANEAENRFANSIKIGTDAGRAYQEAVAFAAQAGTTPPAAVVDPTAAVGQTEVTGTDVKDAVDVYRDFVQKGGAGAGIFQGIANDKPTSMAPRTPITSSVLSAPKLTPAERLTAALQGRVTVEATDTTDLAATAAGKGAGQLAAAARYKQALQSAGQQANALANQARGSERRGVRRDVALQQGENVVAAGAKIEEINATDRMAAQSKIADLDAQKKQTQATLDQARAAGDQAAINNAQAEMLRIDTEIKKANADLMQRTEQGNADRDLDAQTANDAASREDYRIREEARREDARLRLEATQAMQQAAQGLLQEAQREELIKQARAQIALAEQELQFAKDEAARAAAREKRGFWSQLLGSILQGATTVGAAYVTKKAAHGGIVNQPTHLLAGEAGPEIVVPITPSAAQRLGQAMAVDAKPFKGPVDDRALATLLASAALRSRKNRGN
jgi:hypothetical protein